MLNALIRELHRAQKIAVITVMLSILASAVYAGPEGGEVVGGQGAISNSGAETLINQSSQRLAVEWQSFNVGAGETVRFVQPSATAAVLNLIHDQNPSQIFGAIEANGRVFLANPNGLVFGQSATVNVGSLVAAGMSINEKSFMDDNLSFDGMGDGRVVNYGILQAANGGSINLLGSSVDNQGLIIANYGSVNLISGDKILVDFDGDGLIQFQVDKDVIDNAAGVESSVNNSGEIRADAGQVLLNANVAKDIFSRAVNNDGLISAQRIDNSGGVIRLTGNDTVIHSGDITVAGKGQNDTGGRVEILGYNTGLFENASINASGDTGGGEILIGGDYQGNNPNIQNAEFTYVSAGSKIEANANVSGDGGKVIVWADNTTRYKGMIAAKGGEVAGDGGFVEVSGKQILDYDGLVDTRATNGSAGLLLLDPDNITITNDDKKQPETTNYTFGSFGQQFNNNNNNNKNTTSYILAQNLVKFLDKSNVYVLSTGSILVDSEIISESDNSLTLNAVAGDIDVDKKIQIGGDLTLISDSDIKVNEKIQIGGALTLSTKTFYNNSNISAGGSISLTSNKVNLGNPNTIRGSSSFHLQRLSFGKIEIGTRLGQSTDSLLLNIGDLAAFSKGFSEIFIGGGNIYLIYANTDMDFSGAVHFRSNSVWLQSSVTTAGNLSITSTIYGTVNILDKLDVGSFGKSTLEITAKQLQIAKQITAGIIKIKAVPGVSILAMGGDSNPNPSSVDNLGKELLLLSASELALLGQPEIENFTSVLELSSDTLVYLGGKVDYKGARNGIKLLSENDIYIGQLFMRAKSQGTPSDYVLDWLRPNATETGNLYYSIGNISAAALSAEALESTYLFGYENIEIADLFKLSGSNILFKDPFSSADEKVLNFDNIKAGELAFSSPNPVILNLPLSLSVDSGSIDFSKLDFHRKDNASLSLSTQGGSIKLRDVGTDAKKMNSLTLDTAGAGRVFLNGNIHTLNNIDFSKVADIELTSHSSKIISSGDLFLPDIIVKGSNERSLELSGKFISLGNIIGVHDFTMVNSSDNTSTLAGGGVIRANKTISLKGPFDSSGDISFSARNIMLDGSLESDGNISFSADSTRLSGSLNARSLIDFSLAAQTSDIKIGKPGLVLQASEMTFGSSQVKVDGPATGFVLDSGANLDFSKVTKLTLNTDLNIAVNYGDVNLGSTIVGGGSLNGIALNIVQGEIEPRPQSQSTNGVIVLGPIANTVTTLNVNSNNNIELRGDISTLRSLELVSHDSPDDNPGIVTTNISTPITLNSEKIILGGKFKLTPSTPLYLKNSGKKTVLTAGANLDLSDVMLFSDVDKEQGLWVNNNNFVTTLGSVQATDLTIEHSKSAPPKGTLLNETRLKGPIYTTGTKGIVLADGGKLVLDADVLLDTFTNASDGIGGTVHFGVDSTVDSQGHDLTILSGLGIHMESTATVATAAVPSGNIDWTAMLGNIDLGQIDAAGSDVSLAANGGFITSEYMPIDQLDVTMLVNNIIGDSITLLGSSGVGAKVLRPVVIHANKQININVGSGYGFVVNTNKAPIVGRGKVYDVVASRYLTAETAERSAAQSIYTDFYLDNLFEGNEVNVDEYSIDYLMAQYQTDREYSLSSLEPDVPTMLRTATGWKLSRTNRAVRQPEIGNEQIPRRDRTKNSVKSERIEWINRGFKYQIPKSEVRNEAE
jgi:filamentous hemagglutinin family protein